MYLKKSSPKENDVISFLFNLIIFAMALFVALTLSGVLGSETAQAQDNTLIEESIQNHTFIGQSEKETARKWKLNEEEWDRYKEIVNGPRGMWTPNLDPITVLGIAARTDEERLKYASMAAKQELERVRKELDFQREYSKQIALLTKGLPLFDVEKIKNRKKTRLDITEAGDRIVYFTNMTCSTCVATIRKLAKLASLNKGISLDIYIVGADDDKNSDKQVRDWAKQAEIPPELVKQRKITLNHDSGLSTGFGIEEHEYPVMLLRVNKTQQLRPVSLVELGL